MAAHTTRLLGAGTVVVTASAFLVAGAGPAGATPAEPPVPATGGASSGSTAGPHFATLSHRQVENRSGGKRTPMIVVLDDQLTNLPDDQAHHRARAAAAARMQRPLVAQLKQVGATDIHAMSLLNSVSATMPAQEAKALRSTPGVKEVVPDATVVLSSATSATPAVPAARVAKARFKAGSQESCGSPDHPLIEPEALGLIHAQQANEIADGSGVIVGNVDADSLAGNPNMIRPDGQHVIIDAPDPDENTFSDEFNGDVSTIGAQGTVVYSYAEQLPYSNIPQRCSFRIVGDAPGASILSTGFFSNTNAAGQVVAPESEVIAGLQQAVTQGADVVSESYGYGALPGANTDLLVPANDAMVAAGVVVVESAGDSGSSGTVEAPADDPNVIDAAGTNDLRLLAQAYGYQGWEDNSMTTLSSGGTTPNGRVVDLAAPGFTSLAVAGVGQDPPLPTEAFGGTSESAPFIAGAAADVIQAYRDTHGGTSPTPAMVKDILTSTATDLGAPADQQGAGLVDIYAAVRAARQMPGTSSSGSKLAGVVASPSQLDVQGNGGSDVQASVSLYNASSRPATVTGRYRVLGAERTFGSAVTEPVSAPPATAQLPTQGATAAPPVYFDVPSGVDVLDADMIWPDPTNDDANILTFILTDPDGRLAQQSYDYGAANGRNASPDIQHSTVEHPMPGRWEAQIVWNNGRAHLAQPPAAPGSYRGTVTFRAGGQRFSTSPATRPITIGGHRSVQVPLNVALPADPGDHPEAVQFTGPHGVSAVVPIARRTLIPSGGGSFSATLTSSVSRGPGQIKTFYVDVPAGQQDLDVSFSAPDHAVDDPVYYYLYSPDDLRPSLTESGFVDVTATDTTPTPANPTGNASLIATDPQPGLWEIDVMQGATTDGTRFAQTVTGVVRYNQLAPVTETGLPESSSTVIDSGSSVPVSVAVTNSTDHAGLFELQSSAGDLSGGNASTPLQVAPGDTATLTAQLSPTATAGTVVHGTVSVVDSTDRGATEPAIGFPASVSDFHDFGYTYTVGAPGT